MKTVTIETYSFDELSDKAKETARDWFREGMEFDPEFTIDDAKTQFGLCGFDITRIFYRGFWSQGDGACFEGTWRARDVNSKALKENCPLDTELHRIANECDRIALEFQHAYLKVEHRGPYYHENCTDFTLSIVDENEDEIDTAESSEAESDLIEVSRDAMRWIYRQLEKEYEYRNADEQIDESILANEYAFSESGKRTVVLA
jgi:hypothetical protein